MTLLFDCMLKSAAYHPVVPFKMTAERDLKTLVENRTVFNFKNCELNIFETNQSADQVFLRFSGMVFTSMLRGKKMMHVQDATPFVYLPGESVILPESAPMVIDFPEASLGNPTQCLALEIDRQKIRDTLTQLNERHAKVEESKPWDIDYSQFHIHNSLELSDTINRLTRIPVENNPKMKDILAELTVQELLVRLMQTHAYSLLVDQSARLQNQHRFAYVVQYIKEHLSENLSVAKLASMACMSEPHFFRSFKRELGLSPLDYIIRERISAAKNILRTPGTSISEACYRSGFNSLAYFTLQFRRTEGYTPSIFKKMNAAVGR